MPRLSRRVGSVVVVVWLLLLGACVVPPTGAPGTTVRTGGNCSVELRKGEIYGIAFASARMISFFDSNNQPVCGPIFVGVWSSQGGGLCFINVLESTPRGASTSNTRCAPSEYPTGTAWIDAQTPGTLREAFVFIGDPVTSGGTCYTSHPGSNSWDSVSCNWEPWNTPPSGGAQPAIIPPTMSSPGQYKSASAPIPKGSAIGVFRLNAYIPYKYLRTGGFLDNNRVFPCGGPGDWPFNSNGCGPVSGIGDNRGLNKDATGAMSRVSVELNFTTGMATMVAIESCAEIDPSSPVPYPTHRVCGPPHHISVNNLSEPNSLLVNVPGKYGFSVSPDGQKMLGRFAVRGTDAFSDSFTAGTAPTCSLDIDLTVSDDHGVVNVIVNKKDPFPSYELHWYPSGNFDKNTPFSSTATPGGNLCDVGLS